MRILFVIEADKGTVLTLNDYCGAIILVRKQALIRKDLVAALILMAAVKFELAKEVPSDTIHLVELGLVAAKGAAIRVLQKPFGLALPTHGLLARFAL